MVISTFKKAVYKKNRYESIYLITNGVLAGIRTPDRCLRRALLYPAELPGQISKILYNTFEQKTIPKILFLSTNID